MTSPSNAFVWTWLPGASSPVVVGRIDRDGNNYRFAYGDSYLARPDAISLYSPDLPLNRGWIGPPEGQTMAGALWDASPDSWGQRVIIARLTGTQGPAASNIELDKLTYLLESGSNRIGALDFQASSTEYVPRADSASLDELHRASQELEDGELSPSLAQALVHGTSVGGARPKVTLTDGHREYIAKFSSSTDTFPMVKAEAAGMDLARRVGITVPHTELVTSLGRQVLLVERFDRPGHGQRRGMISGLTMLGFGDFLGARYSSYPELLDVLHRRSAVGADLSRAMFERIVFNIAIGNSDDHARNHAAFWDGKNTELTPAYDLAPQPRSGTQERQAMDISRDGSREAQFAVCVAAAEDYGLTRKQARELIDRQVATIRENWTDVADAAQMTNLERNGLLGRQILNPYTFEGY